MNPMRAIREKCLDCTCQQPIEVKECTVKMCALWPFRMGTNPYRSKRVMSPEARAKAAETLSKARVARMEVGR
jgi:hypothetical protein